MLCRIKPYSGHETETLIIVELQAGNVDCGTMISFFPILVTALSTVCLTITAHDNNCYYFYNR